MIKDSGERTEFSTGAVRDMKKGKGRMDLLPWYGIMEVSKHCEEGAEKYGEHNVDKGIPLHSLLDSASRHLAKVMCGETDEDHLRAAAWNILWALNQRTTHPELNDLYFEKKEYKKCEAWIKLSYDDLKDYVGKEVAVDFNTEFNPNNFEHGYFVIRNNPNDINEGYVLIPNCDLASYIHAWLFVRPDSKNFDIYGHLIG